MRRELLVPKLGLTMSEGVLLEWMVAEGESFTAGQSLFVIESEKAANEIAAEADGVLVEISAQPGATLPCGAVIGYWDDGQAGQAPQAADAPPAGTPPADTPTTYTPQAAPAAAARIPVTPLARRLAAQRGIDLSAVTGSGPRGRIRARDLEGVAAASAKPELQAPRQTAQVGALPPAACDPRPGTLSAPASRERVIAEKLTASKQQIPHFYLSVEAEMSAVMALRQQINAAQSHQRLTLNHFILAAVGQALRAMPLANRVWTDAGILTLDRTDVGMAVHTGQGLLVPVLRDVATLSLGAVARQAAAMIERAQQGRLSGDEMQGGSITVSNAGMHDVTYMASIINPGQSMILGVGSVREVFRPDAEGRPAIRREMGMVLSADHRVLDGVTALTFLKRVVQALEQPAGLLAI